MASPVLFETPENVQIAYKTAGLGTRFCAWVVDWIFVVIVAILLWIVGLRSRRRDERHARHSEAKAGSPPPRLTTRGRPVPFFRHAPRL